MADPEARSGVIAGGNWLVDHVKLIDGWPPQDALANIQGDLIGNGGAPYNLLKNLSKLGARFPLAAVGLVGRDADGDYILADCRSHGIDTSNLRRTSAAPTSYTDVMTVASTGRRTFFHQRGANARLGPEHFGFAGNRSKFFHLGYLLLLDRLDRMRNGRPSACEVLRRARRAGLVVSLDCVSENSDRFQRVVRPALAETDVLFVNDFEAEKLTGVRLRAAGAIRTEPVAAAAARLAGFGVRRWMIVHFPEGVYAVDANGRGCWQGSVRVPPGRIKGLAGAGDALAAGILYGLHEDWPMPKCLKLGVAAAAASLEHPTCSEGVRPAADCLALARRFGHRRLP